jgi:hypothetical protein
MIIAQTAMAMSFAQNPGNDLYKAEPKVVLAADRQSYDVSMPIEGDTKICVLFVPHEKSVA